MHQPIVFRSLQSGGNRVGMSQTSVRSRGTSWSHLRPMHDRDDVRDIAWHKVSPSGFSVIERQDQGEFGIIVWHSESQGDQFCTPRYPQSRQIARDEMISSIRTSASIGRYPYRELSGEQGQKNLIQSKPRGSMIFVIGSMRLQDMRILSHHNDVIYLDIIHPFEKNPDHGSLFFGKILSTERYKRAYMNFKKNQYTQFRSSRVTPIPLFTHEDGVRKLNNFFKHRYNSI